MLVMMKIQVNALHLPLLSQNMAKGWGYLKFPLSCMSRTTVKTLIWLHSLAELPSSPAVRADPLVIAVISVFIIMVGILGLVGFLRYRQHNSSMEFRRLQDLPMVSNASALPCTWLSAAWQFSCY